MSIELYYTDDALTEAATILAQAYGFTALKRQAPLQQLSLVLSTQHLQLNIPDMAPLVVDFTSGKAAHRRAYGGGKGQLIAKACGLKAKFIPTIVDLTAGLGRDAFVLATLGADVTLVERNPVIAALLQDGLTRLYASTHGNDVKLSCHFMNAKDFLTRLGPEKYPDIIYLDPMHPERSKSALVKKDMRILRELVGSDEDKVELFETALSFAKRRVVLKWPRHATPITSRRPNIIYEGKSTRFEVYLTKQ